MFSKTRYMFFFLNQDVCFLNQEERRQFLISSVSESDWKREHRLEFKKASNRFYIPNANKFFKAFALPFAVLRGLCERKYRLGARRISNKTSRGISTHFVWFVGDVWSSYGVCPGESTYSGSGTFNADDEFQITITCKTKQWLWLSRHYRRVKYYAEFTVVL